VAPPPESFSVGGNQATPWAADNKQGWRALCRR